MSAGFHRVLAPVEGFDRTTQYVVCMFAAQLEDLSRRLKRDIDHFSVEAFEWQERPGGNSAGMLIVHSMLVEVYWLTVAPKGLSDPEIDARIEQVTGMNAYGDGMPAKPDTIHPDTIKGWTKDRYVAFIDKCRAIVLTEMRTWTDESIRTIYTAGKGTYSYEWTLYHAVEHLAGHYGQILLLRHQMADRGVVARLSDII